jgi:hypothetical protein
MGSMVEGSWLGLRHLPLHHPAGGPLPHRLRRQEEHCFNPSFAGFC